MRRSKSMNCPRCQSANTRAYQKKTGSGYRIFRCPGCRTMINERTGTPFNDVQCPADIVMLVVLWRLRYKLSVRDVVEMFMVRGYSFRHETVRDWAARFASLLQCNCAPGGAVRLENHGMSTKPSSRSTVNGTTFTVPLIGIATWSLPY